MSINKLAKQVHDIAKEKGWWESERSTPECIALMHSELSEALEAYRVYGDGVEASHCYSLDPAEGICSTKPEGVAVELADCIIRILDLCAQRGWDIEDAIKAKVKYNKTRSYRHGNKLA
jgi:NTP pyrophosphatase (non-canonical NTP hydrolase)